MIWPLSRCMLTVTVMSFHTETMFELTVTSHVTFLDLQNWEKSRPWWKTPAVHTTTRGKYIHITVLQSWTVSYIVLLSVSESWSWIRLQFSTFIYIFFTDEAGFNPAKRRGQTWSIIGHRGIMYVPGQLGGAQPLANTMSSIAMPTLVPTTPPISSHSWTHYMASWSGPLVHQPPTIYWLIPPLYSPFLNSIKLIFSAWWWKVFDCHPLTHSPLLQVMKYGCGDVDVGAFGGWIHRSRGFF